MRRKLLWGRLLCVLLAAALPLSTMSCGGGISSNPFKSTTIKVINNTDQRVTVTRHTNNTYVQLGVIEACRSASYSTSGLEGKHTFLATGSKVNVSTYVNVDRDVIWSVLTVEPARAAAQFRDSPEGFVCFEMDYLYP